MAFDDLARHMARRDGKKRVDGDASQILADAERADRRMTRTRDLILGTVLLVGGALVAALILVYTFDIFDQTPDPQRPPETGRVMLPYGLFAAAVGAVFVGLWRVFRGLRGR
jgi:hypothetical protein